MQWCYFQALLTNHMLSSWPCLNPSLSSYCFKADLVYNQGHCCRIQIRDIRVLQGCTWALLPCSSGELMATRCYRDWKKLDNIQGEDTSTAYYWLDRAISRKKCTTPFLTLSLGCSFLAFFIKRTGDLRSVPPFTGIQCSAEKQWSFPVSSSADLNQH